MLTIIRKAAPRFVVPGHQPGNADWQALHRIADSHYPAMVQEFLTAVEAMQNGINQAELVQLLAQGPDAVWLKMAQAWEAGGRQVIEAAWAERFVPLVQAAAQASQASVLALVPPSLHVTLNVVFGQVNTAAVEIARTLAGQRITLITPATLDGVRTVLTRAFTEGRTPDQVARTLARTVGLRPDQVNQLLNYENALAATPKATAAKQQQLVRRFARRLLRQRGEVIMRTETINTASAGQQLLWERAEAQGFLAATLRRFWVITPDDRLCPYCRQIPKLNAEGRGIREPFQMPGGGTVMHPGAHPS